MRSVWVLCGAFAAMCARPGLAETPLQDTSRGAPDSTLERSPAARTVAASSARFDFYCDHWLNLHDMLYRLASDESASIDRGCLDALPTDVAAGWERAESFYRDEMGHRHHRRDSVMVMVRSHLTGLPVDLHPDDRLQEVLARSKMRTRRIARAGGRRMTRAIGSGCKSSWRCSIGTRRAWSRS